MTTNGKMGITLAQLGQRLKEEQDSKRDFVLPSEKFCMQIRENRRPHLEIVDTSTESFPMLPLVHDQLGGRLAIPGKYYDRMLGEQPDLLAMNVNVWLRAAGERRMLRTMGGNARAFVSDRFKRIENVEMLKYAMPALAKIPGARVLDCGLSERRMYIKVVSEKVQGEVKKGDVIQSGVIISNSEVGAGSVSVQSFDWRLVCLNGMVSSQMLRSLHVGRQVEDDGEHFWADDTLKADDEVLLLKMRDAVTAAVDPVRFQTRIGQMQNLAKIEMKSDDPSKVVEVLSAKAGATDAEAAGILKALIKGADLSAWGMVNAVTAQAKVAKSYDRMVELEQAGGRLLSLSRKEWTEVLEAA
jgi:hypothetical protein